MSLKQRSSFVLFMHRFVPVVTVLLAVFSILAINLRTTPVAEAATNSTINFQARLQSASGAIVPDGNYNIEFKLYGASSGGTALWTEDHYNSGSNGLRTVNGYFSTKLGSVTAFPSTINWDQELWLTMNVGGTTTGTPTLDGEMDPRLKLTAVPYAISAGQLQTTNGSYTSKLSIQTPTGGNQVFQIQDQGATGTYNILTAPSGSDGYLKLQGSTPGTQQTGSFNISGTGIAGTLQASDFDRASSGTLTFGNTNATTINIGTNNSAHTVNIATGTGTQTVTLGSSSASSSTIIQGGTGGVGLYASTGGTVGIYIGGNNVLAMDTSGRTVFKPITDDTNTFSVQDSGGGSIFAIQSSTGIIASCATCTIQSGNGGFLTSGGLTFQGTTTTTFRTPGTNGDGSNGANLSTKINIPIYDPGAFNQIIALGLPGSAASTARAITIADARSGSHQATIGILSPDENQIGGLSWDGSNTEFSIKTSSNSVSLKNGTGTGLRLYQANAGATNFQITEFGDNATGQNGVLQLDNATNTNGASLSATNVSASYVSNLPTAIGSANQCLAVSSVASSTQQLGYADCLTTSSGIQLQATTPGTAQTGNFNVSGTGIASVLQATTFDTATGVSMNLGTTNATSINLNQNTSIASGKKLGIGTTAASEALTVNGNFNVRDADTPTKQYRFRTSGTSLDVEGSGASMFISVWTGTNFTGTQRNKIVLDNSTDSLQLIKNVQFRDDAFGTVRHSINGAVGGNVTFNSNGEATDFSVQGDTDTSLLYVKGSTDRVGIGTNAPGYKLDVAGDVNTSGSYRIGGTQICTSTGCTVSAASGILNTTSVQSANAYIQAATSGSVAAKIQANAAGSGGILNLMNGSGGTVVSVGSTGDTVFKAASSTSAFQIQDASGNSMFNFNSSTGSITLGYGGNTVTYTNAGGWVAAGTAQHTKSIVLAPEYTNAVLDAAGDSSCSSANNGTLTSAYDATNYRNYYNWTSTQGTNQCYDVVVDVVLPNDFSSWASSDPINLQALASNTSNAGYAIAIRNVTGAAWDGNYGSVYASPGTISTSWSDVASSSFSGTYAAGDRLSIKVRMTAKSSANLQLGNLTLNYNSKW